MLLAYEGLRRKGRSPTHEDRTRHMGRTDRSASGCRQDIPCLRSASRGRPRLGSLPDSGTPAGSRVRLGFAAPGAGRLGPGVRRGVASCPGSASRRRDPGGRVRGRRRVGDRRVVARRELRSRSVRDAGLPLPTRRKPSTDATVGPVVRHDSGRFGNVRVPCLWPRRPSRTWRALRRAILLGLRGAHEPAMIRQKTEKRNEDAKRRSYGAAWRRIPVGAWSRALLGIRCRGIRKRAGKGRRRWFGWIRMRPGPRWWSRPGWCRWKGPRRSGLAWFLRVNRGAEGRFEDGRVASRFRGVGATPGRLAACRGCSEVMSRDLGRFPSSIATSGGLRARSGARRDDAACSM